MSEDKDCGFSMSKEIKALQSEDLNKYAMYKAYFTGARYYEFSKAYHMYLDIKAKILAVDSSLDFNIDQLKTLWLEASTV